ncbi:MAG UNVERIFIED_CONTAM: hypothetical protein LVR18_18165 [Planctomycetaceae bacterium]
MMVDFLKSGKATRAALLAGHDPAAVFDRLEYLDGARGPSASAEQASRGVTARHSAATCGVWGPADFGKGRSCRLECGPACAESSLALPLRVLRDHQNKVAETAED